MTLTPVAREVVDSANDEFGISRTELTTRLFEWFGRQPKSVRREFVDKAGDPAGELLRIRLAEIQAAGSGDVSGMSVDDALRAIRVLLDRVEAVAGAYQEQLGVTGAGKSKKGK